MTKTPTSREALIDGYEAALAALDAALDAVCDTAPELQDYDHGYAEALDAHQERVRRLHRTIDELDQLRAPLGEVPDRG